MKRILFFLLAVLLPLSAGAQQKDPEGWPQKLKEARSQLSRAHQYILTEDFASTGIYGSGYIETPTDSGVGSGMTQPQGTAADNLKASSELPTAYTIWIQAGGFWYVSVRKEQTAIFLKLQSDADGEMDFARGSGWCIQPVGGGFAQYPYRDGKWGAAQSLAADAVETRIDSWQQEFVLTPAGDMGSDRVKLFEKAAYFDDLDIALPKN